MKRTIVLLATLLLSFGLINAANKVTPIISPDTAWTNPNTATLCEFWIENDIQWHGWSSGFEITTTTGGVTWSWLPEPDGWGPLGPGTGTSTTRVITGSRLDPLDDTFDNTLLVSERDVNGSTPDSIMFGANRNFDPGLDPGSAEACISFKFQATGPLGDVVGDICFTGTTFPTGGDFIYVNTGLSYPLDDIDVTYCYPVKERGTVPPVFTVCPSAVTTFSHCGVGNVTVLAIDGGNPVPLDVSYVVVGNSGAGTADVGLTTGIVTYTPDNPVDINTVITVEVEAQVTGAVSSPNCFLTFTPTNNLPTIDAGVSPVFVGKGNLLVKDDITGGDVDDCDTPLFAFVSIEKVGDPGFVHANTPETDPITGVTTWQTTVLDVGDHIISIQIDDFMHLKQVPATFLVKVLAVEPFEIQIEKADGSSGLGVLQGHFVDLDVTLNLGSEDLGGFDLLIGYDASALTFTEAAPGDLLTQCGWEFFTYRYSWNGNCGNQCPSGLLRIVAIADVNDGPNHPGCYMLPIPPTVSLASLTFLVTNDRTFECMYAPVYFYWMDCGDNTMSSKTGDSLFVNRFVYNYWDGIIWTDITDPMWGFPGAYGAPDDPCMVGMPGKDVPIRFIDFKNGGVDIICAGDIDARGDINVNGIANEIADAVMFTRYFIMGLPAFGPTAENHQEASIAASDVNADGMALSVADLVYLVRIIIGDALPYAKPLPGSMMEITATPVNGEVVVNYNASYDAGAALLVFNVTGTVGTPTLGNGAANMDLTYSVDNGELRVLVYNIGSEAISAGENTLVSIPVTGSAELVSAEAANYNGSIMEVAVHNVPSEFAVAQNYPNPFNPSTTIAFDLPMESDWSVKVYNIAGQIVNDYSGHASAGNVEVVWDGSDVTGNSVASGIYFYKVTASNFSATKKMVLMK